MSSSVHLVSRGNSYPRHTKIFLAVILLATLAAYAGAARCNFAYDDFLQIVYNKQIKSVSFLSGYFTNQVWAQADNRPGNLYRPLFLSWLLINHSLFQLNPMGWHLTTLFLHLLATLLVYLVAQRLVVNARAALFAAAVFGLHPIHVEGVAWISGVTEPMLTSAFLGSFFCYLKYRSDSRWQWLAGSLLTFAAAMLAKETAVVLPGAIALYEACFPPKPGAFNSSKDSRRIKAAALVLFPYVAMVVAYLGVRMAVLHGFAHRMSDVPMWISALTWPWVISFYLGLLAFPVGLGPFYDVSYVSGWGANGIALPVLTLLVAALALGWWKRRSGSQLPIFLGGWWLLTLAPVLVSFVIMSRWEGMHDRYLYLPSFAFCVMAGQGLAGLFPATVPWRGPIMRVGAAGLLLASLAAATWHQVTYWNNDLVLFSRGAATAPRNVLARLNLAAELRRQHQYDGALQVARQAIALDPKSSLALSAAGEAEYFLGDFAECDRYYVQALMQEPARVDQLYYLGLARIKSGKYEGGLAAIRKGLSLWPDAPGYYYALGLGLAGTGDWEGAQRAFRKELSFYPNNASASAALAGLEDARLRNAASKNVP